MIIIKLKHLIFGTLCVICVLVAAIAVSSHFSTQTSTSTTLQDGTPVPIIMYHSILKDTSKSDKYIVTPTAFEQDLKYLKNNGYTTILMEDLINYQKNNTPLPEKSIVLTLDDGYYNNYTYVFPLLKQYDAKAVISVVGAYCDIYSKNSDTNPNYAHLSWEHLKELSDSGIVEIQNHTYNLHSISKGRSGCKKKSGESLDEYTKVLTSDIGLMQEKLTQTLGKPPTTFTYPFGSVSNASFDIIKELGFSASLSCEEGINYLSQDDSLYMLKRCIRTPTRSLETILNKI